MGEIDAGEPAEHQGDQPEKQLTVEDVAEEIRQQHSLSDDRDIVTITHMGDDEHYRKHLAEVRRWQQVISPDGRINWTVANDIYTEEGQRILDAIAKDRKKIDEASPDSEYAQLRRMSSHASARIREIEGLTGGTGVSEGERRDLEVFTFARNVGIPNALSKTAEGHAIGRVNLNSRELATNRKILDVIRTQLPPPAPVS
jgi:hypothetical protein